MILLVIRMKITLFANSNTFFLDVLFFEMQELYFHVTSNEVPK